ncbi:hypothetical protein FB45DRAFT_1057323 [Roridomyces roridus]|uniref:AMP-dependent synthetase/ligase domain-containing protein n=1 Tax=Roridomyces roridus TaxID=1738132 RepID=A0AAD7BVM5_9AGAR|nr:hypothetical protein FB45DRAFT_1057323 [Roridomyces roridus]
MATFLAQDAVLPLPETLPYDKQSVPVPGTKRPGQTAHYVNGLWGPLDLAKHAIKTLPDIFTSGLSTGKDKPLLGYRPLLSKNSLKFGPRYEWYTFGQVDTRRRELGSAIHHLFQTKVCGGGELDTVGLWSINRPEWQMVDLALQAYNKVSVSLYDTLGKDSVEYIINHAHLTIIFATLDHIPGLLKIVHKTPLKVIVSIDALTPETSRVLTEWGQVHGVLVKDLNEMVALGQANLIELLPVSPSDVASICYTSGTTNMPKGVVITHQQFSSSVITNLLGTELPSDGSCMLSYLPLAHIYERVNEMASTAIGGRIGFFTGDPLRLIEDCQVLKPNFFPGVPRVLNRIYQAVMATADVPGFKGDLFRRAYQAKLEKFRTTGDNTHLFWDALVFRKIRAVLGGNLLLISSGSAPISRDVIEFLNVAFSCYVSEGYGMTEGCAIGTKSWKGDKGAGGTVGPVQAATEVKLIDVPAMGYTSEDKPNPRGEICMRGVTCFTTYYKDEKNTKESIDEEGWLHTGDVGEIDSCGRLKIVDRVKNIMKLAQGEYVALEKIENVYSVCPIVAQIYIHGDPLQAFLVGVVIPDPVLLAGLVSKMSGGKTVVSPEDMQALSEACRAPRVNKLILDMLTKEGNKEGLKGFESVKRIQVSMDAFNIEDGTLTPTLKVRRKDAYLKFKAELDGLYTLAEPSSVAKL